METIRMGDCVFQVVDEAPLGYHIWNIGRHMPEGYLPFCRLSRKQPFPGGRNIETDTLKAVRVDGAQDVLAAIGYGCDTLEAMETYVEKHENAHPGTPEYIRTRLYKNAIPVMRKVFKHK